MELAKVIHFGTSYTSLDRQVVESFRSWMKSLIKACSAINGKFLHLYRGLQKLRTFWKPQLSQCFSAFPATPGEMSRELKCIQVMVTISHGSLFNIMTLIEYRSS